MWILPLAAIIVVSLYTSTRGLRKLVGFMEAANGKSMHGARQRGLAGELRTLRSPTLQQSVKQALKLSTQFRLSLLPDNPSKLPRGFRASDSESSCNLVSRIELEDPLRDRLQTCCVD